MHKLHIFSSFTNLFTPYFCTISKASYLPLFASKQETQVTIQNKTYHGKHWCLLSTHFQIKFRFVGEKQPATFSSEKEMGFVLDT